MAEPLSKPALVRNSSINNSCRKSGRRVAFEVPSDNNDHLQHHHHQNHSSDLSDIGTSIDHLEKGRRHPWCFACCAWSCLILFLIIITFLFAGISYLAFLKAGMPHVNVRTMNIAKFQVDDRTQTMNAVISLGLRFSNKNEKLKLLYGPLLVDVSSEDVSLGQTKHNGFSQMPKNDTDMDMTMTLNHANVNKDAADDLKSDIDAYEMIFDVYVSGNIGMEVGSLKMINVPFLSSCHQIKRMDVDFGRKPECEVRMFAFR